MKGVDIQYENALTKFRELLGSKYGVSNEDWIFLKNNLSFESAKKNSILFDAGKVEMCGRILVDGIIKIMSNEPSSYIFDFRQGGDYLCDIVSLTRKSKSAFSYESITKCKWIEINVSFLMQTSETFFNIFSRIIVDYLERGYERTSFLRINNAEQRYLAFCELHPEIVKYAKQADIASFLDITPQSLSRIRKNRFKIN